MPRYGVVRENWKIKINSELCDEQHYRFCGNATHDIDGVSVGKKYNEIFV